MKDPKHRRGHSQLGAETWREIAHIWGNLASLPISKPDDCVRTFWRQFSDLVEFDQAFVVIAQQTDDEAMARRFGFVDGWVPAQMFSLNAERMAEFSGVIETYRREHLEGDVWVRSNLADAGRHRTSRREDVLGDEPWSSCGTGWLLSQLGVTDRMASIHSLEPSLEAHLVFDREDGTEFTARDAEITSETVIGLGPFLARLAMSYGLYRHQGVLRPREREALLHLLDGYSEPEIAEIMGLTAGSVHQYVVKIFRSLNVSSRAELMAKWMSDCPTY